ncbi:hypothetical protein [Azospirillum soli]|uniref:hypothetical protein n=1 Tax=Azospirillum soli TaxID=1304799 RepID=UPI001AE34DE1|nr:hypothetical protein [Azospirillum soli]MBP2311820.1 hypothetical protein [Azospirillum soli]
MIECGRSRDDQNDEAITMWRGADLAVRRVVVSLLMLATLLVSAAPGHASLKPHQPAIAPYEHALIDTHDDAAVTNPGHAPDRCTDFGPLGAACCSVAQCATMHGGLPATMVAAFIPRLDTVIHLPALATPDGIGIDPALRPPL